MKDLPSQRGARKVRAMVAEGEHENQDFKYSISDARKIARSISAFANRGGGRLLIGVKDNGEIAGVRNEEDVYVVELAATRYCRPPVEVAFTAYSIDASMRVIVAEIPMAAVPGVSVVEADGSLRAYYRVADENIAAHPLMEGAWRRRMRSDRFFLGELHSRMAAWCAAGPPADARAAAVALHVTETAAAEAIETLAALGIISFEHTSSGFIVRVAEDLGTQTPAHGRFRNDAKMRGAKKF